jgi:hypothetical protein
MIDQLQRLPFHTFMSARRVAMRRSWILALLVGSSLFVQMSHGVQNSKSPPFFWDNFAKNASVSDCLGFAQERMQSTWHLKISAKTPHFRIGANDAVVVQVACAPTGKPNVTEVMVSAFSTDRSLAERAGKDVAKHITSTTRID